MARLLHVVYGMGLRFRAAHYSGDFRRLGLQESMLGRRVALKNRRIDGVRARRIVQPLPQRFRQKPAGPRPDNVVALKAANNLAANVGRFPEAILLSQQRLYGK
ncbi:MAG: hypothetical protein QGG73_10050 [Candidatus Hydrogenedentes bacterium]|nr:hypothetical protein [Candidatus Hydrogenedentota bacterium]